MCVSTRYAVGRFVGKSEVCSVAAVLLYLYPPSAVSNFEFQLFRIR
jgi:hypothetical protein